MTERTLILQQENVFFHVFNRGVDRQQIFFSPADYLFFIELMRRFLDSSKLVLHAFGLMPNHYHMILQQLIPYATGDYIKRICEIYAQYINKSRKRVGHLFQRRYTPKLVDQESYLLYLSRYVHLNPVAAGLVKSPEEWPYSSCQVYQIGQDSGFVRPELILNSAGGRASYWNYLCAPTVKYHNELEKYLIDREFL